MNTQLFTSYFISNTLQKTKWHVFDRCLNGAADLLILNGVSDHESHVVDLSIVAHGSLPVGVVSDDDTIAANLSITVLFRE